MKKTSVQFRIDPEFKALLPRQTDEELALLREMIETDGCAPGALTVADILGEKLLIDGHTTFEICKEKRLPLSEPRVIKLASRELAKEWMWKRQLARRNLTAEQRSFARGQMHLAHKKPAGRPSGNSPSGGKCSHSDHISEPDGRTVERIAKEAGVSPRTVARDAQFAEAVDAIREEDPAKAEAILNGTSGMSKKEVIETAPMPVKQKRERKAKNGAEKFRPKQYHDAIGPLRRAIDSCANCYGIDIRDPDRQRLIALLGEFHNQFTRYYRKWSGEPFPE